MCTKVIQSYLKYKTKGCIYSWKEQFRTQIEYKILIWNQSRFSYTNWDLVYSFLASVIIDFTFSLPGDVSVVGVQSNNILYDLLIEFIAIKWFHLKPQEVVNQQEEISTIKIYEEHMFFNLFNRWISYSNFLIFLPFLKFIFCMSVIKCNQIFIEL